MLELKVDWPKPLKDCAYFGPLGEYVKLVEERTEADPVAILVQAHVAFGNVVGAGPHILVGADVHHANLFAVMVGQTAAGRKTLSKNIALHAVEGADPHWDKHCRQNGLSTGEGLILAVRDVDDGVAPDRRLLAIETEFVRVLDVSGRKENTLSAVLRQGWDGGRLQVMTKQSPMTSTGAHISLIGHITRADLDRSLTETDIGNGVANRILWPLARRVRLLPEPPPLDSPEVQHVKSVLHDAIANARTNVSAMSRDVAAREQWIAVYPELTEERPGRWGAVTARAEAQVLRLSMVQALADGSSVIRVEHQNAALEIWRYCSDSARLIFGMTETNLVMKKICHALALRPGGLTRAQINKDVFQKNTSAAVIEDAIIQLELDGMITRAFRSHNPGRGAECITPTPKLLHRYGKQSAINADV